MKVLITGVNGFIGQALFSYLSEQTDYSVFGTSRKFYQAGLRPDEIFFVSDISNSTNWMSILSGVDVVIHLAARAHVLEKDGVNSANQFNSTNVDGTLQLARHALQSGVSRFIFISSIGVNGAETINKAFSESDQPNPCAEYAMSKLRAEQELIRLLSNKKMDYVIIRPPLVYAADAPGNFGRLMKAVVLGMPMPFLKIKNQRSLIALPNLISFISLCIEHPAAANQTFLISDMTDLSTKEIIEFLAEGMAQNIFLFPVPDLVMAFFARAVGKQSMYIQLCKSLIVDSTKAVELLGWSPVISARDSLVQVGKEFKSNLG